MFSATFLSGRLPCQPSRKFRAARLQPSRFANASTTLDMATTGVAEHYTQGNVLGLIKEGLTKLGKTPESCSLEDIDSAVQFHIGGVLTAKRLFDAIGLKEGQTVLDVGCGLGGPAMTAATVKKVKVTGIECAHRGI